MLLPLQQRHRHDSKDAAPCLSWRPRRSRAARRSAARWRRRPRMARARRRRPMRRCAHGSARWPPRRPPWRTSAACARTARPSPRQAPWPGPALCGAQRAPVLRAGIEARMRPPSAPGGCMHAGLLRALDIPMQADARESCLRSVRDEATSARRRLLADRLPSPDVIIEAGIPVLTQPGSRPGLRLRPGLERRRRRRGRRARAANAQLRQRQTRHRRARRRPGPGRCPARWGRRGPRRRRRRAPRRARSPRWRMGPAPYRIYSGANHPSVTQRRMTPLTVGGGV